MSLADLPIELLMDVVEYLRPDETNKPITGINGGYKRFIISPRLVTNEQEAQTERSEPLSPYTSLHALAATCLLFKKLCAPLIYEDLNMLLPIKRFDDFYASVVIPNATYVRHIRIDRGVITAEEAATVLEQCHKAKSVATYGTEGTEAPTKTSDSSKLDTAIVKLFEDACMDTLGIYDAYFMGQPAGYSPPLSILRDLSESAKGSLALKRLDLSFEQATPEISCLIRTSFPSLEALTCFGFLTNRHGHPDIWNPTGDYNWAQYTNLTRLQFRDGGTVYSSQVSSLVRHFPSLIHLLVSACDGGGHRAQNVRPDGWYTRKDALWRAHQPLETLHLEHMDDDEIMVMGDIPTKTLIIANLRGDQLTDPLKKDPNLFPGLRYIRIQPPVIPEYSDGAHPFNEHTLIILQEICRQRNILLTRDAEATRLKSRHRY